MITDVLLDEPVAVVAADNRIGQIQVLDHGLQLAAIAFGDFAAEDHRDLVRLPDGAVGIQQALAQVVERGAPRAKPTLGLSGGGARWVAPPP